MGQDDLEHFRLFHAPTPFGLSYSCAAHEEFDFISFSNALAKQSESFIILRMPEEARKRKYHI